MISNITSDILDVISDTLFNIKHLTNDAKPHDIPHDIQRDIQYDIQHYNWQMTWHMTSHMSWHMKWQIMWHKTWYTMTYELNHVITYNVISHLIWHISLYLTWYPTCHLTWHTTWSSPSLRITAPSHAISFLYLASNYYMFLILHSNTSSHTISDFKLLQKFKMWTYFLLT